MEFMTRQQATMGLNFGLHVIILFLFLFIAFYAVLSKITRNLVSGQVTDIINEQTDPLLDQINARIGKRINWDSVDTWAKDLVKKSQGVDPSVSKHNTDLFYMALGILLGMFTMWVAAALYFSYGLKYKLGLGGIIAENIVIFTIIGLFEGYFFAKVATKYVPITASASATAAIDAIKQNVNKRIDVVYPPMKA